MTSTDFASKYRLLKNVATRGARSFLAQQVALGRMVMVHYLDSEQLEERAATVARLNSLQPPARGKLLEIADVDGTPVAVTLFISSFKDFATWLDSVSVAASPPPQPQSPPPAAAAPGEFTRAFRKIEPPAQIETPAPTPAPARSAPPNEGRKKTAGEFTRIFGKVDESTPASSESPLQSSASPSGRNEDAIPTVIMEAMKRPPAQPTSTPPTPAAPAPDSGSSFTAIFGSLVDASHAAPELPIAPPIGTPPSSSVPPALVMSPPPPPMDLRPAAPSPVAQPRAESQPGEFTQLFQRLSPSGGSAPSSPFASPSLAPPEIQRPLEATPRADLTPPPLSPPALGGIGAVLPAPAFGSLGPQSAPSTPKLPEVAPPNANGAPTVPPVMPLPTPPLGAAAPARPWNAPAAPAPIGASVFGTSAPSEFTRILSPIAPPPPPPVSIQPPSAAPTAAAGSAGSAGSSKSMLPLIIALTAVVVLTIVIVAYFVLRK